MKGGSARCDVVSHRHLEVFEGTSGVDDEPGLHSFSLPVWKTSLGGWLITSTQQSPHTDGRHVDQVRYLSLFDSLFASLLPVPRSVACLPAVPIPPSKRVVRTPSLKGFRTTSP